MTDPQFYGGIDTAMRTISRGRADPPPTQQEVDAAYRMLVELQPAVEEDRHRDAALSAACSRILRLASSLGLRRPGDDESA
jgi:hypothetical protein